MSKISISALSNALLPYKNKVEIVERKGIGHPDTMCDNLAEQVSIALSKYYLENYGFVMHHNVDKALLVGGVAQPKYNGGKVIEPIEISVVGRATKEVDGDMIPVDEIALEVMHEWLRNNIRNLDEENHVILTTKIRPGSRDLVELFERFAKAKEVPLANDTSFGVGYYPFDTLESIVYETENVLNSDRIKDKFPFIGEDVKVMGVRNGENYRITVAVALIDKFVSSLEDYIDKINVIKEIVNKEVISEHEIDVEVFINTADSYERESIYLTVTGTSAEHGDDGQVGRGNRVNGLITPYRPMSLEAAAGKNPISHVGKIYNLFANDLAKEIVESGYGEEVYVYIVSQIGKPITEPQSLDIKIKGLDERKENSIRKLAEEKLQEMPKMWEKVLDGKYRVV